VPVQDASRPTAPQAPVSAADVPATPGTEPSSSGLDDLYDIARLAERLGVEHATVRVWLSRRVPWLPQPDGRLNGGAVWRASTLEGIEERRAPGRPGRKPKFVPDAASADVPRTNPVPTAPTAVVVAAARVRRGRHAL